MILQALYELAHFEGLMDDPDFQEIPVAWWIALDASGRLLGIQDKRYLPQAEGKKKPKLVVPPLRVPVRSGRQSNICAQLLVDNAQYTFGLVAPDAAAKPDRVRACFDDYCRLVRACAESTDDPGVRAVLVFLDDVAAQRQRVEWNKEWESNHLFVFTIADEPDRPVHLRPAVVDYWRKQRRLALPVAEAAYHCLVTGQPVSEPGLFPMLKKVPGGSTSGVGLVSFNSTAFESHGWKRNENAPISREASEACARAMNRLLDAAYPDPKQPGVTLPQRHYRLSGDTVACYWSPSASGQEVCDFLSGVFEPRAEQVGELYQSVWRGEAAPLDNPAAFYAVTLTGTQGRVIVRDWFESSVGMVRNNLVAYFKDIDIARNTPPPKSGPLPPRMPLRTMLRALAMKGDEKRLPPDVAGRLFLAAINGTPFPASLLHRAMDRYRTEIGDHEWLNLDRQDARMAIIKASLNRMRRANPAAAQRYPEVKRTMDPTNVEVGYRLGRLMAILEKIQQEALGDVNATIVDRYFKRASTTPQSVFTSLLKGLASHEKKLKRDKPGLAIVRKREIDALLDPVEAAGGIPRTLAVDQQALFLLGYHHQRYALWQKAERVAADAV